MSLVERSDGILETHVQWAEIEEQMQKVFNTTATFGPNKTVKNIGEGNGFLSRISLIQPDWQNGSEVLPDFFIAKICTALSAIDFSNKSCPEFDSSVIVESVLKICLKMHNTEVETYKILQKYNENRIPLPKIYASRAFSDENKTEGYILMEYFDDIVPCHLTDNISIDSIKKVLRSVAIWQGIGLRMTEEEKHMFQKTLLKDTFGDIFTPEVIRGVKLGLESFCGEEHYDLINKFANLLVDFSEKGSFAKLDALPEAFGYRRVFGDLWSTNVLWMKQDDEFVIRAHIDFQTASFNTPALDLARAFSSCLSGKDRRNHYKELLSTFYEYLREEVEGELPYTLDQLEMCYNSLVPFSALGVVPMAPSLYDFLKRDDSETTLKSKEVLLEKTLALMEDAVFSYHSDTVR